ncbi:MAG: MFS transporter [Pseudomonadota bacterium]
MALRRSLLFTNFFAADASGGLGPYLGIYLLSVLGWHAGSIGIVLALGTIATVIVQTPAGALIDKVHWKRTLLALCGGTIGVATVAIPIIGTDAVVYASQILVGIGAAFIGPCIAAMTLGLVGPDNFTRQASANAMGNHTGNVVSATLAAVIALYIAEAGVFYLVGVMAVGMIISIACIPGKEIDHEVARGGLADEGTGEKKPSGFKTLLEDRSLVIFALCIVLFHFANAAMLPLVSQKLSEGSDAEHGTAFTSACIIAAQIVMGIMAWLCGRTADSWGRKPLFLVAFAVMPVRGVLFSLGDDPVYLVAVQALDGVANGVFGVMFLLIVADLTRGTGRFNVVQGALTTLVGIGASLSNLIAEQIADFFGYDTAFLSLACVAIVGLTIFLFFMPETAPHKQKDAVPG